MNVRAASAAPPSIRYPTLSREYEFTKLAQLVPDKSSNPSRTRCWLCHTRSSKLRPSLLRSTKRTSVLFRTPGPSPSKSSLESPPFAGSLTHTRARSFTSPGMLTYDVADKACQYVFGLHSIPS